MGFPAGESHIDKLHPSIHLYPLEGNTMNTIQNALLIGTAGLLAIALSACSAPQSSGFDDELPSGTTVKAEFWDINGTVEFDGNTHDVSTFVMLPHIEWEDDGSDAPLSTEHVLDEAFEAGLIPVPVFAATDNISVTRNEYVAGVYAGEMAKPEADRNPMTWGFDCAEGQVMLMNATEIGAAITAVLEWPEPIEVNSAIINTTLTTSTPCEFGPPAAPTPVENTSSEPNT